MPEPVYVTDAAGVRYRVLDGTMRDGKMVVADPPTSWATFRVFRPKQGQRRLYHLKPGESRTTEPAVLAQQLERAEYLPTRTFEPPADPR